MQSDAKLFFHADVSVNVKHFISSRLQPHNISLFSLYRHDGKTPAVYGRSQKFLRVSSGGEHASLSSASLYRGSGGHQYTPAVFRPAARAAGQPQHHPGGTR